MYKYEIILDGNDEYNILVRKDLIKLINELEIKKDSVIVEIGSHQGSSANTFSDFVKTLYCVDTWDGPIVESHSEKVFNKIYTIKNNINKIKMKSCEACNLFNDEFFDMVYIDADHRYFNVMLDIMNWLPKIKWGGWLTGHDYIKNDPRSLYERRPQPGNYNGDIFEVIRDIFKDTVIDLGDMNWAIKKEKNNEYICKILSYYEE